MRNTKFTEIKKMWEEKDFDNFIVAYMPVVQRYAKKIYGAAGCGLVLPARQGNGEHILQPQAWLPHFRLSGRACHR